MTEGIRILGTGRCAPAREVGNEEFSRLVDTSDEWIRTRTGMQVRRFCESETNLELACGAARAALTRAAVSAEEIGIVVVATFSGDYFVPSMASLVQAELGIPEQSLCFDLNAACSGFLFGLETVHALLCARKGQTAAQKALLIGSEVISRKLDMTDRGTCILFGDGAGAAVVTLSSESHYSSLCYSRGDAHGISCPSAKESDQKIRMDGAAIYRFAVSTVPELIRDTLQQAGVTADDVDWFLCHQANARILDSIARAVHQPQEKFFRNIASYGNTSAASIPMALSEMEERGLLQSGQKILLAGFGAGLTWGAVLLEWQTGGDK